MTASSVAFVCDYPEDVTIASQPNYDKNQWVADNYDYYQHLSDPKKRLRSSGRGRATPCSTRASTRSTLANSLVTAIRMEKRRRNAPFLRGTNWSVRSPFGASSSSGNLGTYTKLLGDEIDKALSGPLATVERYIDDFTTGWKVVVVAGGACPIVLSIAFLFFLRYFTSVFAYTTLFSVNALAVVVTIYLYLKAGVIGSDQVNAYVSKVSDSASASITNYADPAESGQDTLKIFAYISTALTCVIFLFTLLMLRRVKVAVGVIKVATSALGKMPQLTLFPIVPAFAMVCALRLLAHHLRLLVRGG